MPRLYVAVGGVLITLACSRAPTPAQTPCESKDADLMAFHDTFIKLGPLPLPLMRKAMLGDDIGPPF